MMILGEIASGLAIIDWLKKRFTKTSQTEQSVADRFLLLFEKHDVHRSQIPRFFGYGLTIEDTSSSEKLLPKLNHTILEAASELFKVRLEWLEGADEQIYDVHAFYQCPDEFKKFLSTLIKNDQYRLMLKVVISPDSYSGNDALLIIGEPVRQLNDKQIMRYHLCGGWNYRYCKCRADLAGCVAIAQKQKAYVSTVNEVKADIRDCCNGYKFVSDISELPLYIRRNKFLKKQYKAWYPDIWLSHPEKFIEDLDDGTWGKTHAIRLWLQYYEAGYLKTGFGNVNPQAFIQYLEWLEAV